MYGWEGELGYGVGELRREALSIEDRAAHVVAMPFTPSVPRESWPAIEAALEGWSKQGRTVWIELWCRGHRLGAAVRLERDPAGGWDLVPRRTGVPLTVVAMPDDVDLLHLAAEVEVPSRIEIGCGQDGCGANIWIGPQRLIDAILPALYTWAESGNRTRPRVLVANP